MRVAGPRCEEVQQEQGGDQADGRGPAGERDVEDRLSSPTGRAALSRSSTRGYGVGAGTGLQRCGAPGHQTRGLRDLGDRWQRGEVTVAQEHFASAIVRGRLLGLARGWGLGVGPMAVLACLPGEQHDLGLVAFGLALRARGWRIVHLGPDAPLDTVEDACRRLEPSLVVLHAVSGERVKPVAAAIRELARHYRVALGGAAAEPDGFGDDVLLLRGDVISEATRVAA